MPNITAFKRELRKYIADKTEEGLKRRTLNEYQRVNLRVYRMLVEEGLETHPLRIGRTEINHIQLRIPVRHGNFRNQEYHIKTLLGFLKWAGNPDVKKLAPRYPTGVRTKADWLNEEMMETIRLSVEHDPALAMQFHLEGDLALRRIEVHRLRVQDFQGEIVHVLGKGSGDGKPRDLKQHPETPYYLADYLEWRSDLVRRALRFDPDAEVPDGLLIYFSKRRPAPHHQVLGVCGLTTLDNRLKEMRALSALHFGHHTLRRTCAREMWKAGAELVTISEILGHQSLKTTRSYLGLTVEDQAEAHDLRYRRQRELREELRARRLKQREFQPKVAPPG